MRSLLAAILLATALEAPSLSAHTGPFDPAFGEGGMAAYAFQPVAGNQADEASVGCAGPNGSFVGEEDESVYVWIRRFENEQERKRLYDAVYQSDYWKNEISPKVPTMIDREQIKVTRIVATPHSVIQ